jgi:hypothetical protein
MHGPLYDTYHLQEHLVSTRHGRQYKWGTTVDGIHPGTHFASMTTESATHAILHLYVEFPSPPAPPSSFLETLESYGNDSLWENLTVDGDGEWIRHGLALGTLCIVHDGSYMPEEAVDLCSAGVVIFCRSSRNWLKVSVVECSHDASNYRGELLGAVLSLLILQAATTASEAPSSLPTLYCDNRGVIFHCNSQLVALSEKQKHANLIRLVKHLSATNKCRSTWVWVEGHAVERKGWENCTLPGRLNDKADRLAKDALLSDISGGPIMTSDYPFELVRLRLSGERVCGSPPQALEWDWGY